MPLKESKWTVIAEVGSPDNSQLSDDQEHVESKYMRIVADEERRAGDRLPDDVLVQTLMREDNALDEQRALNIVTDYRNNLDLQQPMHTDPPETAVPEIENPVNKEMMMSKDEPLFIDSTIPPSAPLPGGQMTAVSKSKSKYKKNKKKKHLKGEGPKADKANEVYHAIMRDRKKKGEPTKEEQASAAAIAWSQAKKTMKKKAYFRGEEAQVVDSYRGMWGEELVRLSVQGSMVDVPRDSVEFVETEVIDPAQQLSNFVSHVDSDPTSKAEIQASIANLKIAKDYAYKIVTQGIDLISDSEASSIDAIHSSCDHRIKDLSERLASYMTEDDHEYLDTLPQYEVGKEVFVSNFGVGQDGWLDDVFQKQTAEAAEIDIDKLAHEDPLILVAGLTQDVIADAAIVRAFALERVSKLASPLDEETRGKVVTIYLEKAETARRRALSHVKEDLNEEVQEQQKTANSVPDEGLFL
jgi:hypothetical protein